MARDGANSVQNSKMKKSVQFSSPASRVDGQFSSVQFSSVNGVGCLCSVQKVQFSIPFTNCSELFRPWRPVSCCIWH